ncbi:MAG: hypothetical protein ACO3I0_09340 [Limisphaerales bacterium]
MPEASNIVDLRKLLAERFGQAVRPRRTIMPEAVPTGIPMLDSLLEGGWPKGGLSELVGLGVGSGVVQVLHAWIRQTAREGQFLVLVDAGDSLDVDALEPRVLARVLWVRGRSADEALRSADLLLRDRNFPRVVIDLKPCSTKALGRISSSIWHRFRRLTEQHGTTVVVMTPQPLVSGASCRVQVSAGSGLDSIHAGPDAALETLRFELVRSGILQGTQARQMAG